MQSKYPKLLLLETIPIFLQITCNEFHSLGNPEAESKPYTVPIIPLPPLGSSDDDDAILSMFPSDILQSDSNFRPIKVKVIEHDGYIDYEFDIVEEGDGENEDFDLYSDEEQLELE